MNRTQQRRQQSALKRKTQNFGRQIYKIQLPLMGTDVLMYNKDRSVEGRFPVTAELVNLFPEGQMKIFYYGRLLPSGKVELMEKAPWQDW